MDHRDGTPHPIIHSFDLNELPRISRYSIKKRKLPPEPVGLPLSKYKFRDPRHISDEESSSEDSIAEDEDIPLISVEWRDNNPVGDGLKQSIDSIKESSSLTGLWATAMVQDARSRTEILIEEAPHYDQPSYSSDSYDSNTFYAVGNSQSVDRKNLENTKAKEQALFGFKVVEDVFHPEPGNMDELLEFDEYNDNIPSETAGNEIEADDKQIDKAGKATIDQEFEQYFSMLMLQDGTEGNAEKNFMLS